MSDPTEDPELEDPELGTVGNLAAKLAAAMTEIGEIPKNGHNDYHGYDYPLESDVMDALRSELAERGVAIFPSVEGRSVNRVGNEEDGYTLHTRVQLAITLVDSESGEQRTMHWEGEAMDGQDKGLYKAYTSGMKYWALKTFLMSAGDDVERSSPGGGTRQNSRSNGSREATDSQIEFAQDLAQSSIWSDSERESLQERIQNYDRSQMSDLIDQMKSTIEERKAGQNGRQEPSEQAATAGEANHPEFEDANDDLPF